MPRAFFQILPTASPKTCQDGSPTLSNLLSSVLKIPPKTAQVRDSRTGHPRPFILQWLN
jgi:hypothetical protein